MKRISPTSILFLFLLFINTISSSSSSAPPHLFLSDTHSDQTKPAETAQPLPVLLKEDDFSSLMGLMENCESEEDDKEECVNRRMVAEAHLDYIYTQSHKKP